MVCGLLTFTGIGHKMSGEHEKYCNWWYDWHDCNCGAFDIKECKLVIPNTVIMCGEEGNYCSQECMEKANEKNTMR